MFLACWELESRVELLQETTGVKLHWCKCCVSASQQEAANKQAITVFPPLSGKGL